MEEIKKDLPCPDCPEDCARLSETCKVFCKVWKKWEEAHRAPKPRVSTVDSYTLHKHKSIKRRLKNAKR